MPLVQGKVQIVVDCLPSETRILYKSYSIHSFTALPLCHHIHLKHALYQRARKAMNRPLTREEMEGNVYLSCQVYGCETDFSHEVFEMGSKAGQGLANEPQILRLMGGNDRFAEIYPINTLKGSDTCANCLQSMGLHYCLGGCSLCLSCAVISTYSNLKFRCPICGFRFKSDYFNTILQARALQSLPQPSTEVLIDCGSCRHEQSLSDFSKVQQLMHKCWVCNGCLGKWCETREWRQCGSCLEAFGKQDVEDLEAWKAVRTAEMRSPWQSCAMCNTNSGERHFQCYFSVSHPCFLCDFCVCKGLTADRRVLKCPYCGVDFSFKDRTIAIQIHRGDCCQSIYYCQECREGVSRGSFSISSQLSHWWRCKMCDFCWAKGQQRPEELKHCRFCALNWRESDKDVFRKLAIL